MKKILQFYSHIPLILRIIIGLISGILLGITTPYLHFISLFAEVFVGLLKAIAPILVLLLIISSLSGAEKGIASRLKTVILFYILSTFSASVTAVLFSYTFRITIPLTTAANEAVPADLGAVLRNLISSAVMNPVSAIVQSNYIGILTWSVIIGLALRKCANDKTKAVIGDLSATVSETVSWIIGLAPFGIMGLTYNTVSTNGLDIIADYSKLLLLLTSCMLTVSLVIDPLIVAVALHKNPYPLVLKCLRESGVTAFFTRSSAANIPVNLKLCEKLGLDKNYYSVAIPLGATINMNGAAITITVMSLSAAFSQNIEVNIITAILLSLLSTLGACGASGVAGGSLLLIPMACSLLGVDPDTAMQVVGAGFIIAVFQDSLETAVNSSSDVIFCATAELREKEKIRKKLKK